MEQLKKENVFKKFINSLFGENEIEEDYGEIIDPDLLRAQEIADKLGKLIEIPVLSESKTSKNGGFSNGLKKDTLDKMRAKLGSTKTQETTKEIEDIER